ncbi:pyridoxamine 5'-phosphate oxidase family protein [Alicyclobacillus ferrooxydans]|uniref:Pyridoxamine 5-phosphate oxidase n=1 Tax=Alicyclobacillus ferrooxydans TaxID=471514 RepID=A0A0P9C3R1_9BACL|nr:pyridoxamine 5'-phosphate oxidase family protein [Alicyclobacillus ferrooxydans]KPV39370.1 pyridoxamine 5-phosphate oxidase [Alicyclobacillus ferrooxydans]
MFGSNGEREIQKKYGTQSRAQGFYENQMLKKLNPEMMDFITKQQMMFISTADASGNCDTSFRAADAGFVKIIDECTIVYPEYRGNGVYASLGNITENPHIGLLFIDFFNHCIGLHVNGMAFIEQEIESVEDPRAERWVRVVIEEAYIHCSKHIPLLQRLDREIHWGTDNVEYKGGDYFKAKVTKALEKN